MQFALLLHQHLKPFPSEMSLCRGFLNCSSWLRFKYSKIYMNIWTLTSWRKIVFLSDLETILELCYNNNIHIHIYGFFVCILHKLNYISNTSLWFLNICFKSPETFGAGSLGLLQGGFGLLQGAPGLFQPHNPHRSFSLLFTHPCSTRYLKRRQFRSKSETTSERGGFRINDKNKTKS